MYLRNKETLDQYWYIDIETDDLKATTIWCAVCINLATNEQVQLKGRMEVKRFVEAHKDVYWVGHNIQHFDVPTINRLCGTSISADRVVDTLILSYLYNPKIVGGHSLAAYGARLGFPKGDFNDWSKYSEEMLTYCIRDAELGVRVYRELQSRMLRIGYSEQSCELEHKIAAIIDQQQLNGFRFDVVAAQGLYDSLRTEESKVSDSIRDLFRPELVRQGTYKLRTRADGVPYASYTRHLEQYPKVEHDGDVYHTYDWSEFNLGSPKQRVDRLVRAGYKATKFTPTGQPQVDEDSLVAFAKSSGIPEVAALAEWLVLNGRANMINTWLNAVDVGDQCIHGRVFSCGAASRRMTHNSPNTANIPSNEAKYGHECRSLWTARPGRVLVGDDAKAAQMRCFVHFLPNPELGRHYWDTQVCADPHQYNADLIGIARKPVKNVFYANMFGAYPPKLASTAGYQGSKKEMEERGTWIQSELFRITPGLKELTDQAQDEFNRNGGRLRCPDGGYVLCPAKNAALNYKVQPAEAILMKQAEIFMAEKVKANGWDTMLVGSIHDERQRDTDPRVAKEVGEAASQSIRESGEHLGFRVPMDGDYKIGGTWAETH